MFYTEEDIQPAVTLAVKLFGKAGNMSLEKNTLYNVSIATREYGKLWYGDIDGSMADTDTLMSKFSELGRFVNQKIYILDDQFDFNKPILVISI
jgi:hypothetical protein